MRNWMLAGLAALCTPFAAQANAGFDSSDMMMVLTSASTLALRSPLTTGDAGRSVQLCFIKDVYGRIERASDGKQSCRAMYSQANLSQRNGSHHVWWYAPSSRFAWRDAGTNGNLPGPTVKLPTTTPCRTIMPNTGSNHVLGKVVRVGSVNKCEYPSASDPNTKNRANQFQVVVRTQTQGA